MLPFLREQDAERLVIALGLHFVDLAVDVLSRSQTALLDILHRGDDLGGIYIAEGVDELLDRPAAGGGPVVAPSLPRLRTLPPPSPRHAPDDSHHASLSSPSRDESEEWRNRLSEEQPERINIRARSDGAN